MIGSGDDIAASRMNAKLNVSGWISEQFSGIRSAQNLDMLFFNIIPFLVMLEL